MCRVNRELPKCRRSSDARPEECLQDFLSFDYEGIIRRQKGTTDEDPEKKTDAGLHPNSSFCVALISQALTAFLSRRTRPVSIERERKKKERREREKKGASLKRKRGEDRSTSTAVWESSRVMKDFAGADDKNGSRETEEESTFCTLLREGLRERRKKKKKRLFLSGGCVASRLPG